MIADVNQRGNQLINQGFQHCGVARVVWSSGVWAVWLEELCCLQVEIMMALEEKFDITLDEEGKAHCIIII